MVFHIKLANLDCKKSEKSINFNSENLGIHQPNFRDLFLLYPYLCQKSRPNPVHFNEYERNFNFHLSGLCLSGRHRLYLAHLFQAEKFKIFRKELEVGLKIISKKPIEFSNFIIFIYTVPFLTLKTSFCNKHETRLNQMCHTVLLFDCMILTAVRDTNVSKSDKKNISCYLQLSWSRRTFVY